jgi:polysaccharide export outer membrane protein
MKLKLVLALVCLFLSINTIFAQDLSKSIATTASVENNNLIKASGGYIIGNGDLLEIKVVGQDAISGKHRVNDNGQINLPFVGTIQAAGLTDEQLSSALKERYQKYLRNPELSINIMEFNSQFVTVLGSVKTPGRYSLQREVRLFDVIGMAGGMGERAGTSVNLVRYTSNKPTSATSIPDNEISEAVEIISIDLKQLFEGRPELNYVIKPGDLINVPEADTIYVTGNVNKPGSYNTKIPVTLTQAIALAGGMTAEARRSQISLYRSKSGSAEREELTYSLSDLEKRKVKDPVLLPNDVVYIRGSESRSIGLAFVRALTGGVGSSIGFSILR